MTAPPRLTYVAAVVELYLNLPATPQRAKPPDRALAARWETEGIPVSLVETALLLASLRRLLRPTGAPPLPQIRSLAYFQPVIDELRQQPLPDDYAAYLRRKIAKHLFQPPSPAGVQNSTVSRDR